MATPVGDSYGVASGGVIAAGRYRWPAWRRAMAANTWRTIPAANKLADINPANNPATNPVYPSAPEWQGSEGQSGIIADWCGACYDRASDVLHLPLSGGHDGYGGNEPYKIALNADVPTWVMQRPPTGAIGNVINTHASPNTDYMYADGRPKAVHNYNTPVYVPSRGPMLAIHGSATAYQAAGNSGRPILVNPATGEPTYFANNPFINFAAGGERGGSCYDPSRDAIWYLQNVGNSVKFTKFSFADNTWTQFGNVIASLSSNSACYLPDDDCILVLCTSFASGIGVFDCSTGVMTYPSVTGSFVGGINLATTSYASVAPTWVPVINAAAVWDNTSNTTIINLLNKPADPRTGTWTVTQLPVSGSNTVTPTTKVAAGTYGRFQYSPRLDGFVLINGVTQDLYFYART